MAMEMAMAKQQPGRGGGGPDSNWEGMLKGWIPAHLDDEFHRGNYQPSAAAHSAPPKWRGMAAKCPPPWEDYNVYDRVFDIHSTLSFQHDGFLELDIMEDLLDELLAYAEDFDIFNVIDSEGYLSDILPVLYNTHANVRAKAAELIATVLKIYPTQENKESVIDGKGLHLLLYNLFQDPDATSRTKALGAISALHRNNKPGITIFRLANGYAALRGPLSSECVGVQRDALNLIQYLLQENSSDCNIVTELGFPCIMMHLASSVDAEVRKAVLKVLLLLAREEEGQLVKNDDAVRQILQKLIEGISAMAPEDLGSTRDEIQLVDSLWNACYNEPSSLASKLFEPPPRALAAAEATDGNSLSEKEDPLLVGLVPPSAATTPTVQGN